MDLYRLLRRVIVGPEPETQTDAESGGQPPDPPPTAVIPDPRDARIAELEARLAELEGYGPPAPPPVVGSSAGFDALARIEELKAQGVDEPVAVEQAVYEKRLYDDRQAAQV